MNIPSNVKSAVVDKTETIKWLILAMQIEQDPYTLAQLARRLQSISNQIVDLTEIR